MAIALLHHGTPRRGFTVGKIPARPSKRVRRWKYATMFELWYLFVEEFTRPLDGEYNQTVFSLKAFISLLKLDLQTS